MGVIWAIFYNSRSFLSLSDVLKSFVSGIFIEVNIPFKILGDIPSGPGGLLLLIIHNWSPTSSSVMKSSSQFSLIKDGGPGPWTRTSGSLVIDETWAKYLFNNVAFSTGWKIRLPSDLNGDIGSKFLLSFDIDFIILHHFSGGMDLSIKDDIFLL